MKKLNMSYHTKYCTCCGRLSEAIWRYLHKKRPVKGVREWKGHNVCNYNKESFYDSNRLEFCGNCGVVLDDEDIHSQWESRGECHGFPSRENIITGYKCSKCGWEEKF